MTIMVIKTSLDRLLFFAIFSGFGRIAAEIKKMLYEVCVKDGFRLFSSRQDAISAVKKTPKKWFSAHFGTERCNFGSEKKRSTKKHAFSVLLPVGVRVWYYCTADAAAEATICVLPLCGDAMPLGSKIRFLCNLLALLLSGRTKKLSY